MTLRASEHLLLPLTLAALTMSLAQAFAQGAFPAPLPGQSAPTTKALLFPQENKTPSGAGGPSDTCKEFLLLREEAERRGRLVKAASERHASPKEACRLIRDFYQSEIKMIEYVQANSSKCEIPQVVADMLKAGHKNTEAIQTKVCAAEQEAREARPSLNEILGPPKREPAGPVGDFGR